MWWQAQSPETGDKMPTEIRSRKQTQRNALLHHEWTTTAATQGQSPSTRDGASPTSRLEGIVEVATTATSLACAARICHELYGAKIKKRN